MIPTLSFNKDFLAMVVAVIGTTLSAYLYTWQSNEEVEEEKESGRVLLSQRKGASQEELRHSQRDVLFGMFFSNVAMYFIILATASTLFKAGKTEIDSAAQAAMSLWIMCVVDGLDDQHGSRSRAEGALESID